MLSINEGFQNNVSELHYWQSCPTKLFKCADIRKGR